MAATATTFDWCRVAARNQQPISITIGIGPVSATRDFRPVVLMLAAAVLCHCLAHCPGSLRHRLGLAQRGVHRRDDAALPEAGSDSVESRSGLSGPSIGEIGGLTQQARRGKPRRCAPDCTGISGEGSAGRAALPGMLRARPARPGVLPELRSGPVRRGREPHAATSEAQPRPGPSCRPRRIRWITQRSQMPPIRPDGSPLERVPGGYVPPSPGLDPSALTTHPSNLSPSRLPSGSSVSLRVGARPISLAGRAPAAEEPGPGAPGGPTGRGGRRSGRGRRRRRPRRRSPGRRPLPTRQSRRRFRVLRSPRRRLPPRPRRSPRRRPASRPARNRYRSSSRSAWSPPARSSASPACSCRGRHERHRDRHRAHRRLAAAAEPVGLGDAGRPPCCSFSARSCSARQRAATAPRNDYPSSRPSSAG